MTRNLGETNLPCKRRSGDPMAAYDTLPPILRRWLAGAALPWSPRSARRIWAKSLAKGMSPEEALCVLANAEARTLQKDQRAIRIE